MPPFLCSGPQGPSLASPGKGRGGGHTGPPISLQGPNFWAQLGLSLLLALPDCSLLGVSWMPGDRKQTQGRKPRLWRTTHSLGSHSSCQVTYLQVRAFRTSLSPVNLSVPHPSSNQRRPLHIAGQPFSQIVIQPILLSSVNDSSVHLFSFHAIMLVFESLLVSSCPPLFLRSD